jgi:hypothetical protein
LAGWWRVLIQLVQELVAIVARVRVAVDVGLLDSLILSGFFFFLVGLFLLIGLLLLLDGLLLL